MRNSDRDWEAEGDEPDEGEWRAIEMDGLIEEIRALKAAFAAQQRELDAAIRIIARFRERSSDPTRGRERG